MARRRIHRGFALVDVMAGGVLLGIGLAVVMSVASRSLSNQTDGERQLVASWLADELLSMVVVEGPVVYRQKYDLTGGFDAPFQEFEYELLIEDRGVGEPYGVTAVIRWPVAAGYRSIQVQTLVALRRGDEYQPREPVEPVDREARWYDDETTP